MAKKWYVVHVFSGSEKKVCQNIEEQIISKDMGSIHSPENYFKIDSKTQTEKNLL